MKGTIHVDIHIIFALYANYDEKQGKKGSKNNQRDDLNAWNERTNIAQQNIKEWKKNGNAIILCITCPLWCALGSAKIQNEDIH